MEMLTDKKYIKGVVKLRSLKPDEFSPGILVFWRNQSNIISSGIIANVNKTTIDFVACGDNTKYGADDHIYNEEYLYDNGHNSIFYDFKIAIVECVDTKTCYVIDINNIAAFEPHIQKSAYTIYPKEHSFVIENGVANFGTEQITIEEATRRGFTLCGFKKDDYQCLITIQNLTMDDFDSKYPIVCADPKPIYRVFGSIELLEMVSENIMNSEDFGDDTDIIPDALAAGVPWDDFTNKINDVLAQHPYYKLTDIEILPPTE